MATERKRMKDMPSRLQLRCPKCGEEFAFPRGKLEEERSMLVQRAEEAKVHLGEINKLPKSEHTEQTWREKKYWSRLYHKSTARLSEIKVLLRQVSEPITSDMFHLYRERIKEAYGLDVDDDILKWAKENLEAYQISGLSAHEFYTHKGGQIVRKV